MENAPTAIIIEDDPTLTTICDRALTSSGFNTTIVVDGKVAIEHINEVRPNLVLLDLHLPHVSGEAILKHIRLDSHLKETQVIIISADAVLAKFLQHDADLVLNKPVSYHQLRRLSQRLHSTYTNSA